MTGREGTAEIEEVLPNFQCRETDEVEEAYYDSMIPLL